jgi:hypothetical protein
MASGGTGQSFTKFALFPLTMIMGQPARLAAIKSLAVSPTNHVSAGLKW